MDQTRPLPTQWVAAAPFRYHVQHLMAAAQVPWQLVAIAAQLPQQQVRTLLFGRDGQRRPRVSPNAARSLLAVTTDQLLALRSQELPATLVQENVTALLAEDLTVDDLAAWLSIDSESVRRLADGQGSCSLVTAAMLRFACAQRRMTHEPEAKVAA